MATYSITNVLTNLSASGDTTIDSGGTATVTLSAESGYQIPIDISVSGADYEYNDATGIITLSSPTGDVTITASALTQEQRFYDDMNGIADIISEKSGIPGLKTIPEIKSAANSIQVGGDVSSVNGQTGDVTLTASDIDTAGGDTVEEALGKKYVKPNTGIPASDLAAGVIPSVPTASTTAPIVDGTASAGSSSNWSRGDHVHPTDTSRMAANLKGAANGVAELDANGRVPTSQLPSYVDDVVEYATVNNFPATGETGKIYVALNTNLTYRWGGTEYVEISPSLALGETSSTAYPGDKGAQALNLATAALPKSGGTMTGAIAMGSNKITGLGTPTNNADAATKQYVDNGLSGKQNALAAQTAYTAKGTATKVPQITTNNLGQVTEITEVDIPDNNTWRPINVNGTQVLPNTAGGNALGLTAGSNVTLTNSNGTVTIAATDTTYENKSAASGGTDVSLVTTGEKYTWNNKQSKITASGILKGNGSGTISAATAGTDYAAPSSVVTQASIDANGLITYKNSSGTSLFTLQLPLYNGGVS